MMARRVQSYTARSCKTQQLEFLRSALQRTHWQTHWHCGHEKEAATFSDALVDVCGSFPPSATVRFFVPHLLFDQRLN